MLMDAQSSLALLDRYQLPYPKMALCSTKRDVLESASSMVFPLVLKASSRQESHKTEKGLVQLGIHDAAELLHAFNRLSHKARHFRLDAFVLQEQAHGAELMVGGLNDSVFGPSILFGLGGIYSELLHDVAVRVCPLEKKDAFDLLSETKASAFFQEGGFRGMHAGKKPMVELLLTLSSLMQNEPIHSLDFNPVMADEKKALVVDPRIMVLD